MTYSEIVEWFHSQTYKPNAESSLFAKRIYSLEYHKNLNSWSIFIMSLLKNEPVPFEYSNLMHRIGNWGN